MKRKVKILIFSCLIVIVTGVQSLKADSASSDKFADFIFSNKKYAEKIEIKAYLVDEQTLSDFFKDTSKEVVQKSYKELFKKEGYVLLGTRHFGYCRAWGILKFRIDHLGYKDVSINRVPYESWEYYVIPVYEIAWENSNDKPKIQVK